MTNDDHGPKHQCTCPSKVEGPNVYTEKDRVAAITLSSGTSLIEPMAIFGASRDRNRSFEALRRALSSRGGRESLHALPTGQTIGVIDVLEQLNWIGDYPYCGGGNADVWRGVYRGSRVAIKVLRVNSKNLARLEREFCHEVVLWKQFNHPNLLQLVGAKFSPPSLVMISEWMEHGTIMDFVVAFPETNRLKLLADVARGPKYLHDWPSVHADLKSSNILIDNHHTACITDFGLTSLLRHPSISISATPPAWGGTYRWMAPELFDGKSRPSKESDIYALGMVIYEVFAHEQPFSRVCSRVAPALVIAGERPPRPMNRGVLGLSEDIWVLMEKCWDWAPSTRPHAVDVLVLLETASRDWVSPASEAIANLSLGCPINQHSSTTESVDTMPETMFVTNGGAMGHREAAKSPPTPNGEERIAVTTA